MNRPFFLLVLVALSQSLSVYNAGVCDGYYDGIYSCVNNIPYQWVEPALSSRHSDTYSTRFFFDVFDGQRIWPAGTSIQLDSDGAIRKYSDNYDYVAAWAYSYPSTLYYLGGYMADEVIGTAPNRVHIITYVGSSAYTSSPSEVQMRIFETTGNYEFHFRSSIRGGNDYHLSGFESINYSNYDQYINFPIYSSGVQLTQSAFGMYHNAQPQASVCGNGVVEGSEQCDGGLCCTAECTFASVDHVCRASGGLCDIADSCTGNSAECPSDLKLFAGSPCPENFGVCNVNTARTCDGVSDTCSGIPIPALSEASLNWLSYNVISFGDLIGDTGAIGGRAAAKNSVSFGQGFSVGYEVRQSLLGDNNQASIIVPHRYSLVGGHSVSWQDGGLFPFSYAGSILTEGMFAGESFSGPSYLAERVTASASTEGRYLDSDFDDAKNYYAAISNNLANEITNVIAVSQWSGLFLTCTESSSRYVASIDASEINAATWYSVDSSCDYGSAWIINVVGNAEVQFSGASFPGIVEQVIFNIVGSRTVKILSGVTGTILAVDSTVVQEGGNTLGLVIANSIDMISSTTNPRCDAFRAFDIVVMTGSGNEQRAREIMEAGEAGSNTVQVQSFSQIVVGDVCTIGGSTVKYTVEERIVDGGNYLRVSPDLNNNVPAGSQVVCNVANPSAERPQDSITEVGAENSAPLTAISFLLMMLALML